METEADGWQEYLEQELERRFRELGLPSQLSATRFWQLGVEIPPELLEEAVKEIAVWSSRGSDDPRKRKLSIAVLLHILNTGLANISLGYFWPEIAQRFLGSTDDANAIAEFFRPMLGQCYPRQMGRITHRNRFVFLAVDQAGVGRNRKEIISKFLHFLIDRRMHLTAAEEDLETELERLVGRFIQDNAEAGDIRFFHEILAKTGATLVHLAHAVFESNERSEMALWTWEELQTFWFQRSGKYLEQVIPEAKEIFLDIIGAIGNTVNRHELLRICRSSDYEVEYPGEVELAPHAYFHEVPLMPVAFSRGGHVRRVEVVDETGLSGRQVCDLAPQTWRPIRQHFVYFSKKSFSVRIGQSVESAAPVLVGTGEGLSTRPGGFFWSGSSRFGVLPEIDGSGERPDLPPSFRTHVRWILNNSSLAGKVLGFWLHHVEGIRSGRIYTATGNSVTCEIGAHRSYQRLDPSLRHPLKEPSDPVAVTLELDDGNTLSSETIFPWIDQHFWSVGGMLWETLKPVAVSGHSTVSLFTPLGAKVEASGVSVSLREKSGGAFDQTHNEYLISGLASAAVEVKMDGSLLYLGAGRTPRFTRQEKKKFKKDGVVLRVTGDLIAAFEETAHTVLIHNLLNEDDWMVGAKAVGQPEKTRSLGLLFESGILSRQDGECVLDIRALASTSLEGRNDLFELRLIHRAGLEADRISVFDAAGAIERPWSVPDELPAVVFSDGQLGKRRYESDSLPSAVTGTSRSGTTLRTDDETGVALVWEPRLSEIRLVDAEGKTINQTGDDRIIPLDGLKIVIKGNPRYYRFLVDGNPLSVEAADGMPVAQLLADIETGTLADGVMFEGHSASGRIRRWKIAASPKLAEITLEAIRNEGIMVAARWTGAPGRALAVDLSDGDRKLASGEIYPEQPDAETCSGQTILGSPSLGNVRTDIGMVLSCILSFGGKVLETRKLCIGGEEAPKLWGKVAEPDLSAFLKDSTERDPAEALYLLVLLSRVLYQNTEGSRHYSSSALKKWADDSFPVIIERATLYRGIELVVQMAGNQVFRTIPALEEDFTAIALVVNSAYMINESRKWRHGTADPGVLLAGAEYFAGYLGKEAPAGHEAWCEDMRSFSIDCAGGKAERSLNAAGPAPEIYPESLIFDDGFFRWKSSSGN